MPELAPADQELLDCVKKRVRGFEQTQGCHYRDGLWTRMDRLYHSYTGLKRALNGTKGRQRDDIYADARKEFGHELFVPFSYSIVETVLPALLSNRPRILILPQDQDSDCNVEHLKALIDSQQSSINIELRLQSVIKSGLQYGLGVGKSYWLRREAQVAKVVPASTALRVAAALKGDFSEASRWAVQTAVEPVFDDPTFEHVPVRDFGWDPYAANIDGARYAWHRTWRDTAYCQSRLQDPAGWNRIQLADEDLRNNNQSAQRYHDSVRGPFDAQYIPMPGLTGERATDIHEVIEYHDRAQIVTVLDRQWVVSVVPNEVWAGRLPFHCYRPTEVLNQFVGKGEIEPIEDMQEEMNQIRTDRRWNSAMAMAPVIFYNDGMIDPDKILTGPGELNAVNGDPNDIIKIMEIPDVPNSSWRETAEIAQDIVRTSGISDSFSGGDSSGETATGVQLQLARASARIQLKTHRAEIELMKPVGRHWVALDQRHILEARDVRIPAPPVPGEPERRWSWFQLGPGELAGEFDVEVDGGSTTPDNVPQMRQDAQIKLTLLASPAGQLFDPRQMAISILEDLSVKNPESKLNQGALVPPEVLQVISQHLVELGVDPNVAMQVVQGSLQEVLAGQDQQAQAPDHGQGTPGQQQPGAQPQQPQQGPPGQQAA